MATKRLIRRLRIVAPAVLGAGLGIALLFTADWVTARAERLVNPSSAAPVSGPVIYGNCADARAAGAAPIRIGQPGYRPALDADRDGVACDPRPASSPQATARTRLPPSMNRSMVSAVRFVKRTQALIRH